MRRLKKRVKKIMKGSTAKIISVSVTFMPDRMIKEISTLMPEMKKFSGP